MDKNKIPYISIYEFLAEEIKKKKLGLKSLEKMRKEELNNILFFYFKGNPPLKKLTKNEIIFHLTGRDVKLEKNKNKICKFLLFNKT